MFAKFEYSHGYFKLTVDGSEWQSTQTFLEKYECVFSKYVRSNGNVRFTFLAASPKAIRAISKRLNHNPLKCCRSDYSFTVNYKQVTYKRLSKVLPLDTELTKSNCVDLLVRNYISPQLVRDMLNPSLQR